MLALGRSVNEITALYREHVPTVMRKSNSDDRSDALAKLSEAIFGDAEFDDIETSIGIVTTKWVLERPMVERRPLLPDLE